MTTLFVAILFIAQSNSFAASNVTKACPITLSASGCQDACDKVKGTITGSDGGSGDGYCTFEPRNGNFPPKGKKAPEKKNKDN
jgi:hypothetical protein